MAVNYGITIGIVFGLLADPMAQTFFFSKGFVDIFENVEKFEEMDSVLFDHLVRLSKTRNR